MSTEFREQVQALINETRAEFREKMTSLINGQSLENASDTPDFILAQYLESCLIAFNTAVQSRDQWYRKEKSDGWEDQTLVEQATEILRYIDSDKHQTLVPGGRVELLRRSLDNRVLRSAEFHPDDRVTDRPPAGKSV